MSRQLVAPLEQRLRPGRVELGLEPINEVITAAEDELRLAAIGDQDQNRCCGYFPALAWMSGIRTELQRAGSRTDRPSPTQRLPLVRPPPRSSIPLVVADAGQDGRKFVIPEVSGERTSYRISSASSADLRSALARAWTGVLARGLQHSDQLSLGFRANRVSRLAGAKLPRG